MGKMIAAKTNIARLPYLLDPPAMARFVVELDLASAISGRAVVLLPPARSR